MAYIFNLILELDLCIILLKLPRSVCLPLILFFPNATQKLLAYEVKIYELNQRKRRKVLIDASRCLPRLRLSK